MTDDIITHELTEGGKIRHTNLLVTLTVDHIDETGGIECTDNHGQEWYFERELVDRGINQGFIQTEIEP